MKPAMKPITHSHIINIQSTAAQQQMLGSLGQRMLHTAASEQFKGMRTAGCHDTAAEQSYALCALLNPPTKVENIKETRVQLYNLHDLSPILSDV
jgi:hypothetical protein